MAYALANPLAKVAAMGANSLWFYSDGDTNSTQVASGYFNLSYPEVKQFDIILAVGTNGGTAEIDVLTVTSETGATTVTTSKLA